MSGNHQSTVPVEVAKFFGIYRRPAIADHPTIGQTFRPESGWVRYPWRKRISGSEVRKLRAAGVTAVALDLHGRRADFRIEELGR